jgi:hypothetical protein
MGMNGISYSEQGFSESYLLFFISSVPTTKTSRLLHMELKQNLTECLDCSIPRSFIEAIPNAEVTQPKVIRKDDDE